MLHGLPSLMLPSIKHDSFHVLLCHAGANGNTHEMLLAKKGAKRHNFGWVQFCMQMKHDAAHSLAPSHCSYYACTPPSLPSHVPMRSRGSSEAFSVLASEVGSFTRADVRLVPASPDNVTWHLESVTVTNTTTSECDLFFIFPFTMSLQYRHWFEETQQLLHDT